MDEQDKAVIEAVTQFVYRRHSDLTPWNVIGFDEDDLARLKTAKGGYLIFTVEDVEISEKKKRTTVIRSGMCLPLSCSR